MEMKIKFLIDWRQFKAGKEYTVTSVMANALIRAAIARPVVKDGIH